MFARLLSAGAEKKNAYAVYNALVTQARSVSFYTDYGVPDTIEGRFDMILLHLFLVDVRLEKEGQPYVRIRRFIQEAMVSDMDRSFRELGIGDMSVGKEMKKVGGAWLGRRAAYVAASSSNAEPNAISETVQKNIYRGEADDGIAKLVKYIGKTNIFLDAATISAPENCEFLFPAA